MPESVTPSHCVLSKGLRLQWRRQRVTGGPQFSRQNISIL